MGRGRFGVNMSGPWWPKSAARIRIVVGSALVLVTVVLAAAAPAWGAGPTLVSDIDPGANGSNPGELTSSNGVLFFDADDGTHGDELWRSDGTAAGTAMVKDINPNAGSFISELINVGGTLYFRADDGTHGSELWKSDGTNAGTTMVKDINAGGAGSTPLHLTDVGGTLFFTADDGTNGRELWKSDGTAAGTTMVKDINAGGTSNPTELVNVGGTLFFHADDGVHGDELWKSDGTSAGTTLVKDIVPGAGSSNISEPTNVNGAVFFSAFDGNVFSLWRSDGTAAGTVPVKSVSGSVPEFLTNVAGTLFFSADDGNNGRELWKSDGTAGGTTIVKDINPGAPASDPDSLTAFNATLFFQANDGTDGVELWKSDGTGAGTTMVKDINPGGADSSPTGFTSSGGQLYFSASEPTHGRELWRTDGTSAGTTMVADINPGAANSFPAPLLDVNGTLFFGADDGTHGDEPWTLAGAPVRRPTAIGVNCAPATVSVAQATTCTATVSDTGPNPASTPTGSVTFSSDSHGSFGNPGASCTLDAGGVCRVDYTPTMADSGTHRISASYGGDAAHTASNGTGTLTVTAPAPRSTSTAVSCSLSSVNLGQASTCTATATDTAAGPGSTPSGTVTFGSDSHGVFTSPGTTCTLDASGSCHVDYTPSALDSGTHHLTASYSGDGGHTGSSGSTDLTVTSPAPGKRNTTMGVFCANYPINVGQPVSCEVEVRDTGAGTQTTPTGTIAVGTDSQGTFSRPGASCTLSENFVGSGACTVDYTPSAVGSGTHTIAAAYAGDATHKGTSSTTTLTVQPASSVDVVVTGIEVTQAVQNEGCGGCLGTLPSRDPHDLSAPGQATYQGVTMAAQKYTIVRVFAHAFAGNSFLSRLPGRASAVRQSTARLEIFDSLGRRIDVLNPDSTPNSLNPPSCGVCVDLAERADPGTSFNFLVPWQDASHSFLTFRATVTPPVGPGQPGQCPGCGGNTFTLSRVPFLNTVTVPIHPIPLTLGGRRSAQTVSQVFGDSQTVLPNQLVLYPYDAPLSVDRRGIFGLPVPGLSGSLTTLQAAAAVAQRGSDDHLSNAEYPIGVFYSGEGSLANGLTTGSLYLGNGPASIVLDSGRSLTSVTHEIGHGLGLPHADTGSPITYTLPFVGTVTQYIGPHPDGTPDCGGNSGGQVGEPWGPDNEGRLQSVGLDRRSWDFGRPASDLSTYVEGYDHSGIRTADVSNGARYYDFMSYCPAGGVFENLDWISARNWSQLITVHNAFRPPPLPPPAADRGPRAASEAPLRVIATVAPDGTASIFDVAPGQQTAGGPTPGSPYQIELRDAGGNVLQSVVPTTTSVHMDGSAPGTLLTATVPSAQAMASVVLTSGGQVLASRARSPHAPTVTFVSPRPRSRIGGSATTIVRWHAHDADGGPLATTIDYSADGGRDWKVVADGLTGDSARVSSRLLSRSSRGRLRVRVSDGFNVTTVASGLLHVSGSPPLVQILGARSGGTVLANAPLLLTAWAFDDAGRPLTGRSLKWFAGRNLLGRGDRLSARGLPLGTKAIRLIATDSHGRTSQATLRLRVRPVPTKYLVWRAPASISVHTRNLRIVVASISPATFTIAGKRYAVSPRARTITLRIRPGHSVLRVKCVLRAPGGVVRGTYVVSRRR